MQMKPRGMAVGVIAMVCLAHASAAHAQTQQLNQYEQAAIKVVSDWMALWVANKPDEMGQYVTDDIKFHLDPSFPVQTGRQAFTCQMRRIAANLVVKDVSYYAVGDKVFALVIQRRTRVFQGTPPAGMDPEIPVGAFFVVKNGKIAEWLDVAIGIDVAARNAARQGAGQGQAGGQAAAPGC